MGLLQSSDGMAITHLFMQNLRFNHPPGNYITRRWYLQATIKPSNDSARSVFATLSLFQIGVFRPGFEAVAFYGSRHWTPSEVSRDLPPKYGKSQLLQRARV